VRDTVDIYKTKGPAGLQQATEEMKENPEISWQAVKPTWANALKLISAIKSRGIVSTTLDITGIDNSQGERVSDDIYNERKISCFGDITKNINPCFRLQYVAQRGYFCGGCGCGKNELARLDSDSPDAYTKLHYPKLECPLRRKGFSNYPNESILSIIITCCNEPEAFLNRTIDSIRKTAGHRPEIIIIDDASTVPVKSKERVIRNDTRIGVGRSRHKGATFASNPYVSFTDGHMIFDAE